MHHDHQRTAHCCNLHFRALDNFRLASLTLRKRVRNHRVVNWGPTGPGVQTRRISQSDQFRRIGYTSPRVLLILTFFAREENPHARLLMGQLFQNGVSHRLHLTIDTRLFLVSVFSAPRPGVGVEKTNYGGSSGSRAKLPMAKTGAGCYIIYMKSCFERGSLGLVVLRLSPMVHRSPANFLILVPGDVLRRGPSPDPTPDPLSGKPHPPGPILNLLLYPIRDSSRNMPLTPLSAYLYIDPHRWAEWKNPWKVLWIAGSRGHSPS